MLAQLRSVTCVCVRSSPHPPPSPPRQACLPSTLAHQLLQHSTLSLAPITPHEHKASSCEAHACVRSSPPSPRALPPPQVLLPSSALARQLLQRPLPDLFLMQPHTHTRPTPSPRHTCAFSSKRCTSVPATSTAPASSLAGSSLRPRARCTCAMPILDSLMGPPGGIQGRELTRVSPACLQPQGR